ncbi:three-helix bundle dimerization domain-containing protein [Streptomyces sp. NPDC048425]|uniref:three-helix bundle dimerization domain-containing protein n=1 Tax=Streptomyces sp. NPDC048425 TaxID=3365548 RepID=UPI00372458BD
MPGRGGHDGRRADVPGRRRAGPSRGGEPLARRGASRPLLWGGRNPKCRRIRRPSSRPRRTWPSTTWWGDCGKPGPRSPRTSSRPVRSAYDSSLQARVRAYLPILVERRARRTLGAAAGGHTIRSGELRPGEEVVGEELVGDFGRASPAHHGVHRAAEGGAGVEGPSGPGLRPRPS